MKIVKIKYSATGNKYECIESLSPIKIGYADFPFKSSFHCGKE